MRSVIIVFLFLVSCNSSAATPISTAEASYKFSAVNDWAHWRGPLYNGSSEAVLLPTQFSKTENVKWVTNLPGPSAATPIILGDKIFLSSTDLKNKTLLAMCLDRKTGKVLWSKKTDSGYRAPGKPAVMRISSKENFAHPSPVTDGKVVVFFYGHGDLVAFDLEGKKLWARNIQKEYGDFCFQWTFGSGPTLYEGSLFMQVLQRDEVVHGRGKQGAESFLLAIDPATGKNVWRHLRPSKAKKESLESYATPIPYENNGRKELLIMGGDVVTGHDPKTGKELWRWGTWNPGHKEQWWRVVPSPVVGAGRVLVCAPKKGPMYAVELGASGTVNYPKGLSWQSQKSSALRSDVPTPAFYRGNFYVLNDFNRVVSAADAKTGKLLWTTKLSRNYKWRASPTVADGKVYLMDHHGEVVVLDCLTGKILNKTLMGEDLDDNTRASISVAGKNIFIRCNSKLYCIGK
jgi:outer membrane protein assembly factor BamB